MDFNKLRAQALESGQDEEAVTVNTRALIDKVLARYSGEWTTLRELIQNAADAQATTVKIKFETIPSATVPAPSSGASKSDILRHTLLNHTLKTLVVTNNGDVFNKNDWDRLKRIAEGNPDETKIGAFGVGFYSVFADCEEPFVQSGKEAMAFYWKTNSLFTRRVKLPEDPSGEGLNTNFVLGYRNTTSAVPNLLSIAQFLATSMTFVALHQIELWLDEFKVLSLQKKVAPSVDVPLSRDVDSKTKEGLMKVQSLSRESVQMDATFMNVIGYKPSIAAGISKERNFGDTSYGSEAPSLRSFFSRLTSSSSTANLKTKAAKEEKALQEIVLEDLTAFTTANVFLRVTTASIRTSITSSFAAELERATKKPPPKTTKMAILTSTFDETNASSVIAKEAKVAKSVDIFASVLPSGGNQKGRVFIGFPTSQTTGAGFHISAPSVIPTVERESIDLNARWVRTWNVELLRVAGIMSRLSFASEMNILSENVMRETKLAGREGKITKEVIAKHIPEALHILNTFTFNESTPSGQVKQITEEAFWTTYKRPSIEIFSTRGVLSTTQVRIATNDFSGFVEGIPVIPDELVASDFITKLRDFGLLTEITVADVKKELATKALNKSQLVAFINWIGKEAIKGAIDAATIQSLLDTTVATISEDGSSGGIITLSTIKYYRNPNKIPPELPASTETISHEMTRLSSHNELQALGWEPLEIVPWVRFLVESRQGRNGLSSDYDITWSPKFSAQVLAIISKQWEALSPSSKSTLMSLLTPLSIIPTKFGMRIPSEAYFASVRLFDDLPIVQGCNGVKEKVFAALGVRKTVELEKIFERLLNPSPVNKENEAITPKWSHVELITYLASVKDDIPADDLKKLQMTPICAAEAGPPGQESTKGSVKRYKISELFEPKDTLRQLDLPIIQWPTKAGYRAGSEEGRFLTFLGLRSAPSVPELVEMMSNPDVPTRTRGMHYFIANHHTHAYARFNLGISAAHFLPIQNDDKRLVSPSECFTNEKSALLGFSILRRDLALHANKFGVLENPPMTDCINRLIANPPQTKRDAVTMFGYFSSRTGEIGQNHTAKLGDASIVPVLVKSGPQEKADSTPKIRHISPQVTFIGRSSAYENIFDFVDFSAEANTFLLFVGAKHEPSRAQVANLISAEPARILGVVQSPEKYLEILRTLAVALPELKKDKSLFKQMKTAPFLLSTRQISSKKAEKSEVLGDIDEDDDDGIVQQFILQSAARIVVADDFSSFRLFKTDLICAPFEESLEAFYLALGASTISSLVQDEVSLGSPAAGGDAYAKKMEKHILERSKLFLHEYRPDEIKHNAKWLEKNLSLDMVSGITLRRSLRGYPGSSHTTKQTARLNHDRLKGWVLYLTPKTDMWHVAQTLVIQILQRPSTQATTMFEFILTADLHGLKRRGYNVDRILRSNAAEARIAEAERQKQLEAEQQQIKEQETQWRQEQQALAPASGNGRNGRRKSGKVDMPGAFEDESPEPSPVQASKKPRGFLQGLRRNLGLDQEVPQQLSDFLGDPGPSQRPDQPPPYTNATGETRSVGNRANQTEVASSPAAIHQNLLNAVKASRSHDSSELYSAPQTNEIKETSNYCDSQHAHDIQMVGTAPNGMRVFTARELSMDTNAFLAQNVAAIQSFSTLLFDVSDIYGLSRSAMHIFYDEKGPTIAFNRAGAIFCNLRFFLQMHSSRTATPVGKVEAASYWWVVVSHELAHNLVKDHSADHSFYTESFVAQYFPGMMRKAGEYAQRVGVSEQRRIEAPQGSLLD